MVFTCKHLLIAAAAAFLISALSIQQTKAIEIPGTLGQCLQKIEPRVCDPQNVLSEDERTKLDALLVRVEEGTKREGYPLKIRSKGCGSNGITMPVVQLKIASDDMDTLQTQLTDLLQEYTDAHPCKRIAFVVLNADDDKVENRRFWTGTNWNVNVKPMEVVALYRDAIKFVQNADYAQALSSIAEKFLNMAASRLNVPFAEAQIVTANNNTGPIDGAGTQQNNAVVEQQSEKIPAEQTVDAQSN
uniref:TPM domain-containing protein n=1 Tax=Globodera rostochiensis TaxID=31243 RepID=A0A914IEC9_GLORO